MLRYFAIATVLVALVLIVLTSLHARVGGSGARTRYVPATGTPGPGERRHRPARSTEDVSGAAPWILSALPGCFTQTHEVRGSRTYVLPHVPRGLADIPVGSILRSADCAVVRRSSGELRVFRGGDVNVVVAPVVAFSISQAGGARESRTLVLIVRAGSKLILRRYLTKADAVVVP